MNDTATMTIKQTAEEFARARQRHDWREIAGEWFEAPVRRWIGTLDADGEPEDDTGDAVILAVGMREFLALRDVMLVAAIRGERADFTADRAIGFLRRPMMRDNVRWMEDMPAETFHGSQAPDRRRCMKAVDLLLALIGRLDGGDDGWRAQPYATVAYILWWLGDGRALPMAVRALARDGKCFLAVIVAGAIHRGLYPDRTNAGWRAIRPPPAPGVAGTAPRRNGRGIDPSPYGIPRPVSAGRRGRIRRPFPDLPHGRKPDVSGPSRNPRAGTGRPGPRVRRNGAQARRHPMVFLFCRSARALDHIGVAEPVKPAAHGPKGPGRRV